MARSKKTHYKRSTPVIRLRRNVAKMDKNSKLVHGRLFTWRASTNPDLVASLNLAKEISELVDKLDHHVGRLENSGFVPPKRSSAVHFESGQTVAILAKHRSKYEEAFEKVLREDPEMLDGLKVLKTMPSGEIVVQRGQRTPFIARKSHLVLVP